MRQVGLGMVLFFLASCSTGTPPSPLPAGPVPEATTPMQLEDLGPAPELNNTIWLNTDSPLRLADLRGKVVLLEMWTFG